MLLGLLLAFAMQPGPGKPIDTIVTDMMSQIEMPKQVAARTPAEWTAVWRQHAGDTALPKVDFKSRTVVAVFLGTRSSAGYAVEITGTRHDKSALIVEWRERRPERGTVSAQVITSPAHIATIPKFAGEIRFEKVER
ncbi:MAG TPA: protease complex subunit PrcB family protein [Vicinamibacterales bacterium]|nr:protease complex subunit PrcB family protein [Vicinamibacterales bacterium]